VITKETIIPTEDIKYPYILLDRFTDLEALLVQSISSGDLSVVVKDRNNKLRCITSIDRNPSNMGLLISLCKPTLIINANKKVKLSSNADYIMVKGVF